MKKLLFSHDSPELQPLIELIKSQDRKTLIMWVFDCAPRVLSIFEGEFPNDSRPRNALEAAKIWARGEIKMPLAKKAILAAHKSSAEAVKSPHAQAAARAIAHGASTPHVKTHALGLVYYGLTAIIYLEGVENKDEIVKRECSFFEERLLFWAENIKNVDTPWAKFLK